MSNWYDRVAANSFKPAEGGFVFRCPNPWLFGRWRTYLVNEDQKRRLMACLGQRQRLVVRLLVTYLMIALALTILFRSSDPFTDISTSALLGVLSLIVPAVLVLVLVPHFYLLRQIDPILAEVRRTDDQSSLHEQIVAVATTIKPIHVALGGLGGVLITASNVRSLLQELSPEGTGSPTWSVIGILVGIGLMGYFGYLALLKRKLKG
jgi:hypothetical protein